MDVRFAPSACCLFSGARSATTPTRKPPPLSRTALAPAGSRAPRRSNPQQRVLPDRLASERRRGEHEATTVVAGSLSAGGEPCAPMLPTAKPKPLPTESPARPKPQPASRRAATPRSNSDVATPAKEKSGSGSEPMPPPAAGPNPGRRLVTSPTSPDRLRAAADVEAEPV